LDGEFRIVQRVQRLTAEEVRGAVGAALAEDIGPGDVTTLSTVPENSQVEAWIIAREDLVVAGLEFAKEAFRQLSPSVQAREVVQDGERVSKGERLMELRGPARAILTGERVALNFIQRLSGVATLTRQFEEAVKGTRAKILDTRKTTPGWRKFEKYAVQCGGGTNHRFGLFDLVLIKDNHLAALRNEKPNAIGAAVQRARKNYPNLKIEVEADTLEQVQQGLDAKADIILLDNMSLDELRTAVGMTGERALLEASGGVTLQSVRGIAETGVDLISVGALTHSARAVDIALDFST
jgi:nicotinate-nucleotide pyrophosphorylase (carboxylating)